MDIVSNLIAGFGLAAPAGLNAWLPLFIVGLAGKLNFIKLTSPFDILSNIWVLGILLILLTIEVFTDKIPAIDSINDIVHTFIRPVAGGILFAAQSGIIHSGMDPTVSFILGLLSAGSVHAVKATSRPLITATTAGLVNPIVSFVEDIIAAVATVLALVAPILAAIIMGAIVLVAARIVWRWRARRRKSKQAQNISP